jgi:hypothetical protein
MPLGFSAECPKGNNANKRVNRIQPTKAVMVVIVLWCSLFQPSDFGLFSMAWKPKSLQLGQRPMVYFFHDQAPSRIPYFPQGSVNPHRVQRTCQPGARSSGFITVSQPND